MEDKKDPPSQKSVVEIEIPDLKKDEKEKKKGGIAWGSTGNGTSFVGAKGAAGAASSAARAAGAAASRVAAAAAPQAIGTAAPAFISTIAGKLILIAGIALLGGGSAVMISRSKNASATPALGAISATIKAPKPETDARALYFAARAAKGQLRFARTKKDEQMAKERAAAEAQAAAQAAAAQAAAEAAEQAEEEKMAGGQPEGGIESVGNTITDQMEHNLSGAKLSTDLGKQFKGKDIFENAPKFGEGFGKEKLDKFAGRVMDKGRAGRMTSARIAGNGKISMRGGKKFSDSLGHLDGMNKLSSKIYKGKKMEDGKEVSTTQFENTQMAEGVAPPTSAVDDMAPPPNPPSSSGSGPIATQDGTNVDVGGYQSQISQAQNLGNKASSNNILSIALMTIGFICMAIGIAMTASIFGWTMAAFWFWLGFVMFAAGAVAMATSKNQAAQANTAVQGTGQSYQAQQAQKCIADAIANHTSTKNCNASTEVKPLTDPLPEAPAPAPQQSPLPVPPSED